MAFGYIYYDGRHVHVRWPRGRTSNLAKVESVMNAVSMRSVHVKIKPLAPPGETASEKTLVPGKNSGRLEITCRPWLVMLSKVTTSQALESTVTSLRTKSANPDRNWPINTNQLVHSS